MNKAYFILNLKPKKAHLSFQTKGRPSVLYSLKKVNWSKRPYFLMKKGPLHKEDRKLMLLNLETIQRLF